MGFFAKLLGIEPKKQPVHLEDGNFEEEVLRSGVPVVIDVWGPNCAPCKQLEPVIQTLAATYDGRVKVCEMGTHFAPKAATMLRVTGTPTVVYFQKGKEKERVVGVRGAVYHEQTIAEVFGIPKEADA